MTSPTQHTLALLGECMSHVIAIDPGPQKSALIICNGGKPEITRYSPNEDFLPWLRAWRETGTAPVCPLVIEMIGHYGSGMPAGKEVFDTCVWIGRFTEAYGADNTHRLLRATVKTHLCGTPRAKDANVRQALIDRFGGKEKAIGRKASPGPLYGVVSHLWSALAVAITYWDLNLGPQ